MQMFFSFTRLFKNWNEKWHLCPKHVESLLHYLVVVVSPHRGTWPPIHSLLFANQADEDDDLNFQYPKNAIRAKEQCASPWLSAVGCLLVHRHVVHCPGHPQSAMVVERGWGWYLSGAK